MFEEGATTLVDAILYVQTEQLSAGLGFRRCVGVRIWRTRHSVDSAQFRESFNMCNGQDSCQTRKFYMCNVMCKAWTKINALAGSRYPCHSSCDIVHRRKQRMVL
jgi:hypothetical protein